MCSGAVTTRNQPISFRPSAAPRNMSKWYFPIFFLFRSVASMIVVCSFQASPGGIKKATTAQNTQKSRASGLTHHSDKNVQADNNAVNAKQNQASRNVSLFSLFQKVRPSR